MQSPIIELERKEIFLIKWLEAKGITVPIEGIIGLAYTNEVIIEDRTWNDILTNHEIPVWLYNISVSEEGMNRKTINKIAYEVAQGHQEYNPFPLTKTMNIEKKDIKTGVICPKCKLLGMKWKQKKWWCPQCSHNAKDCHFPLLNDWFYLIDERITNREFREFSGIEQQSVAKRLLKNSGLLMKGYRRTSFYTK